MSSGATSTTIITARSFVARDQSAVAALYTIGADTVSIDYPDAHDMVALCKWYMYDKLKPSGDMNNIMSHYMENPIFKGKSHFFVPEINNDIVGFVGTIPSSEYEEKSGLCVEITRAYDDARKL
jgi:hypothetical protein